MGSIVWFLLVLFSAVAVKYGPGLQTSDGSAVLDILKYSFIWVAVAARSQLGAQLWV